MKRLSEGRMLRWVTDTYFVVCGAQLQSTLCGAAALYHVPWSTDRGRRGALRGAEVNQ